MFTAKLDIYSSWKLKFQIQDVISEYGSNFIPLCLVKKLLKEKFGYEVPDLYKEAYLPFYILSLHLTLLKKITYLEERKWVSLSMLKCQTL
jgi:hypothetical protein